MVGRTLPFKLEKQFSGRFGRPFDQRMCAFSRQSLKTELNREMSHSNEEVIVKRKMKNQRQAAFIKKLKLLQEKKNKYLRLLLEEEQELDLEIAKLELYC